MPVYDEMIDRLEDMLDDCCKDKIKPTDIDPIKDIVDSIYKLHKINMLEDVEAGEYGNSYRAYGDDDMMMHDGAYNGDGGHVYGARGGRTSRRRDSRGRYMGRRYGHDKETMIRGLEEKMQDLSGEDQDIMRRAIKIVERR